MFTVLYFNLKTFYVLNNAINIEIGLRDSWNSERHLLLLFGSFLPFKIICKLQIFPVLPKSFYEEGEVTTDS
jgi:hypothetical protein